MFKVKRNYGNGFEVEVSAEKMPEVIEHLSVCDDLFMDVRCAAEVDGSVVVSEKVRFQHRKVGEDHFYEQVCMDGKLKWFKRKIGQHKGSAIGSMYVSTKPTEDQNTTPGYAGWGKYNGSGQQGGYSQQRESAPPPPPPPREPERQASRPVSYEDIPF